MANPVGTMFVELSLDATKYTRAQQEILKGAEKNSADIEKTFKTVGITSDKMYDAMRQNIKNAYEAIKQSSTSTHAEIERASIASAAKLKKIDEDQFGQKNSLIDKMKKNWQEALLAIGAVAGAVAGAKSLASSFIDTASSMERYRITLNQTMGDAKKGGQVFDEMISFAAKTPFTFDEIIRSATTLSGVLTGGLPEIKKYLPIIGDLAATYNMTFEEATSNFVRFFSAGANAADLFQLKGVNAMLGLKAGISINTEESMAALMKHYEAADSKFRGVTEKLSISWTGTISMFEDTWTLLEKSVMDSGVFDSVKWGLQEILKGINELQKSGDITAWAKTIGASLITSFQMIIATVGLLHETWLTFMTVVKTGVERLVVGIVSLIQGVITPINFLFDSMAKLGVIAKNPLDGINTVLKNIKDATKETTSQAVTSQKETALAYGTVLGKLDDYKKKIFDVENTHIEFAKKVTKNEEKITKETEEELKKRLKKEKEATEAAEKELKKRLNEEKKAKEEAGKILDDYYEDYQQSMKKSLEDGLKELEKDKENQAKIKEELSKDINKIDDQYFKNIKEKYKEQAREYKHALADDPTSVAKVAEWLDEKLRKTDAEFTKYKIENYENLSDKLVKKDEEYWNLRKLDLENQAKEFERKCNSQEMSQKKLNENLKELSIEKAEEEIKYLKNELAIFDATTTGKIEKNTAYWQLRKSQIEAEATLYALKTGDMTKADTQRKEQFLLLKVEEAKASDDFFGGMKAQMEYIASKDTGAGEWAESVSSFLKTPFKDEEGKPMDDMKTFFSEIGLGLTATATGSEKSFRTWGEAGAAVIGDVGKKGGNLFSSTVSDSMVSLMKGDMDAFQATWEKYWSNLGETILKKIADELTELAVSKAFEKVVEYASPLLGGSGSDTAGTRGAVEDVATGVGTTVAGKVIGGKILGEGAATGIATAGAGTGTATAGTGTGIGSGVMGGVTATGIATAGAYGIAAAAIGGLLYGMFFGGKKDTNPQAILAHAEEKRINSIKILSELYDNPEKYLGDFYYSKQQSIMNFLNEKMSVGNWGENAELILSQLVSDYLPEFNPLFKQRSEYQVGGLLDTIDPTSGFFVGHQGEEIVNKENVNTLRGVIEAAKITAATTTGGMSFSLKKQLLLENTFVNYIENLIESFNENKEILSNVPLLFGTELEKNTEKTTEQIKAINSILNINFEKILFETKNAIEEIKKIQIHVISMPAASIPIASAIPNFDVGGRLELKDDQGFFIGKRGETILTESQIANISGAKTDRPLHIAIEVGGEHFEKKITKLADNVRVKAERRKLGTERMIH